VCIGSHRSTSRHRWADTLLGPSWLLHWSECPDVPGLVVAARDRSPAWKCLHQSGRWSAHPRIPGRRSVRAYSHKFHYLDLLSIYILDMSHKHNNLRITSRRVRIMWSLWTLICPRLAVRQINAIEAFIVLHCLWRILKFIIKLYFINTPLNSLRHMALYKCLSVDWLTMYVLSHT